MKRNIHLIPLSHEHHYALLCCWKVREGVRKNVPYERIRQYIGYFWKQHLLRHFETEEMVLPELDDQALRMLMEKEHQDIARIFSRIHQSDDSQLLLDFADALQRHIRFEERTVFPAYESALSKAQLSEIGEKLKKSVPVKDEDYPDQFWK
ncbi:hemerythrin domain-containing protein [Daejeonia sp. YH14]|uniref:hemerythrin domain-containing protein n=1 Tax=Daejeonia sp. YH14 TaxID=3439042 RepID=UPI003F4931CF